jgi:hypothetical protein
MLSEVLIRRTLPTSRLRIEHLVLLLSCLVVMGASEPSPNAANPSALNPHLIYARCIKAMSENPFPPYMTYVLNVDADHISISRRYDGNDMPITILHFKISHHQHAYRVWYRGRDQKSLMQDLGSKEIAVAPPIPWALDFRNRPEVPDPPAPLETASSGAIATNEEGALLREVTTDQSPYYRITFAGMETVDSHPVYHLLLQSTSGDPNAHALRELFVDTTSFRARELVMEVGQHTVLYGGRLELKAMFSQVGPYWLNTSGTIEGRGYYAIFFLNGSYVYNASDFDFPAHLPDAYFRAPTTPATTGLPGNGGPADGSAPDFNH